MSLLLQTKGVNLVEVFFPLKQARVWGAQAVVSELIESVEDVGFEAMLRPDVGTNSSGSGSGSGGGRPDVGTNSSGSEEDEPDAVFAFEQRIHPANDPVRVQKLLLQVRM